VGVDRRHRRHARVCVALQLSTTFLINTACRKTDKTLPQEDAYVMDDESAALEAMGLPTAFGGQVGSVRQWSQQLRPGALTETYGGDWLHCSSRGGRRGEAGQSSHKVSDTSHMTNSNHSCAGAGARPTQLLPALVMASHNQAPCCDDVAVLALPYLLEHAAVMG
jgi:hypothetical protein